jgi:hypothetical protein
MDARQLLNDLPPFRNNQLLVEKRQSVDDIIAEVLESHQFFVNDYDRIAGSFIRSSWDSTCRNLFRFCHTNIPYVVETEQVQTSRSPAAVIAMSGAWGGDCKHYAGFIAGVIDAIGRQTKQPINWCYRFAAYPPDNMLGHVFVVAWPNGIETWIDPVLNHYDQRQPKPTDFIDNRPSMSLYRISGVGQTTTTGYRSNVHANTLGDDILDTASALETYLTGSGQKPASPTPGTTTTSSTIASSTAALDAAVPGLGETLNSVVNALPDGSTKTYLKEQLSNPSATFKQWLQLITGRKYTSGDYKLGEIFMRNILGNSTIQSWEAVPDQVVPVAWAFFTPAMGVRIRTFDDLDALAAYAPDPAQRAHNYLYRDANENLPGDISLAAATRAAIIVGDPGNEGGLFNIYTHRDTKWPLTTFSAKEYILPMPGLIADTLFQGTHPITGATFVNGYPVGFTGPRYMSQTNATIQPPSMATAAPGGTPGNPNPVTAGFSGTTAIILALVGAGVLYANSNHGHRKTVSGTNRKHAGLLLPLVLLAAGGYWWYTKTKTAVPPAPPQPDLAVSSGGGAAPLLPAATVVAPVPGTVVNPNPPVYASEPQLQQNLYSGGGSGNDGGNGQQQISDILTFTG